MMRLAGKGCKAGCVVRVEKPSTGRLPGDGHAMADGDCTGPDRVIPSLSMYLICIVKSGRRG
jgi:hypothetical protein